MAVAMLLIAVTRRRRLSATAVTVGFVALKIVPGVAELVAPLLGGVTRRDASDLFALGILWPLLAWLATDATERHESARLVARVTGVMAAMMAVGATSCADPDEITGFVVEGSSVFAHLPDSVTVTSAGPSCVRRPRSGAQ